MVIYERIKAYYNGFCASEEWTNQLLNITILYQVVIIRTNQIKAVQLTRQKINILMRLFGTNDAVGYNSNKLKYNK